MKIHTILPADTYTIVNKSILTEIDRKILINLYEPIIGSISVSLYLTLWSDLDKKELISKNYTHHHLVTILKCNLEMIKTARETLESVGLVRTYFKEGNINDYVYELYSPMSAYDFFNHPVLNVVLYNNIGKVEYDNLREYYGKVKIDLKEYEDISVSMDTTFKSISDDKYNNNEINRDEVLGPVIDDSADFDFIMSSLPKGLINERTFNKKTKELINALIYIYDLDNLKIVELIRKVINENGVIDKEDLRKEARKYYQYVNNGALPTLIYRTQPDYLKNPNGDESNRGKMLFVFENTTPFDFLKNKYHGTTPTTRDLKLLESLAVDLELKPAVINVLIDYVLRSNNNKLVSTFVETIAGQWKRLGIETANEAMELAEKEHKKYSKKIPAKLKEEHLPMWFNKENEKEIISAEEQKELDDLLKEFR